MNHSRTRLFERAAGGISLRNQKIFQPILSRPSAKKVNVDTRKIMTDPTPEQAVKKVLDQSFAQVKNAEKKNAHKSSPLASAPHSPPSVPLNPIISSDASVTFGNSQPSARKKRKSLTKTERPRKKQKKSLKSSIFDDYM